MINYLISTQPVLSKSWTVDIWRITLDYLFSTTTSYFFRNQSLQRKFFFLLSDNKSNERIDNIQKKDNECYRWCLVRSLNPVKKNQAKKILFKKKDYAKKKKKKIENVFCLNNVPISTFVLNTEHHTLFILQNKLLKNCWSITNTKL